MHNQSDGDTIKKGATELERQIPNLVKKWGHILQDDYNIQMNAVRYWIRATAMEIAYLGYSYKAYAEIWLMLKYCERKTLIHG